MTPSVVRTVEELEGLPVGSVVRDDSGDVLEVLVIQGGFFAGRYLYSGRSADYDSQTVPLPATVLAPLSVTDMDDAAKFELALEEYAKLISPHKDHWITPDSRGGFEAGWEAALAAMGIPVVEP